MYNCLAPNSETNQLIRQPNCSFKGPLNLISEYGRRKKYEHEKKILYFEGVRILEQVAQRGCGCLLWRYPKSSWMFSFATYFRECAGIGLDDSLPIPTTLLFWDSVTKWMLVWDDEGLNLATWKGNILLGILSSQALEAWKEHDKYKQSQRSLLTFASRENELILTVHILFSSQRLWTARVDNHPWRSECINVLVNRLIFQWFWESISFLKY